MGNDAPSHVLDETRTLISAGRWRDALGILRTADAADALTAAGLDMLAETAWLCGELAESLPARERAYQRHLREGDAARAGLAALMVSWEHEDSHGSAQAAGWVRRAERHLEDAGPCAGLGYLAWFRARDALWRCDFETAQEHALEARALARRFGDPDLEALATWYRGYALVGSGRSDAGFALMDEAMASAVGGGVRPYIAGFLFCLNVTKCRLLGDLRRAAEWVEAQQRWCADTQVGVFPSFCRVNLASILCAQGVWSEAERAALAACSELESLHVQTDLGDASRALGEVLCRRGDDRGAERAFLRAVELGFDPQPEFARLRLEQGRVGEAREMLASSLVEISAEDVAAAWLHATAVKAAVLDGDLESARTSLDALEALATRYPHPVEAAELAEARGRVLAAAGDRDAGLSELRRAVKLWRDDVRDPYRAAQARLAVANLLEACDNRAAAERELLAARATLASLDARRDLAAVDARLSRPTGAVTRSTLMFTDVVRSTPLVEAIGDAAWTNLVAWHDRTLRGIFAAHGGREVDHAGDGFFVEFRDVTAAVDAAVDIQRTLDTHRREHGFAPELRIGLHAGDVHADGAALRGHGVHLAARLAAGAEAGEILVSADTLDGIGDVTVVGRRHLHLAGIAEPVAAVSVDWTRRRSPPAAAAP